MIAGYRIEEVLGRGGMGIVYLARDPWLERPVALKLIAPELAEDGDFRDRFLRESQLAASLENASVVPIYEAGEADGALYLAMRYAEGGDLHSLLAEEGRLEPSRAFGILERVGVALDAAHAKGLAHLDVKPGNVLVSETGDVYLSDFGLTRRRNESGAAAEPGEVVGTLGYLAPEQIENRDVSTTTDVYALACVLFECLTGEVPFGRDSTLGAMFAHLHEDRPSASERVQELPVEIDAVLARGMAVSGEGRYASCGEGRYASCGELCAAARLVLSSDEEGGRAGNAGTSRPSLVERNPYKGLRAFGEADAADFYGREQLGRELLERLAGGARLTAVVGPSGSGKSSVVSAGLLPLVRAGAFPGSDRWPIVQMTPGAHPFKELEAALRAHAASGPAEDVTLLPDQARGLVDMAERFLVADPDAELLLVLDQFEELFTMVGDDESRERFLAVLETAALDADSRVRIVLSLRADFYDRPLRYSGFSNLVEDGTVAVHPLTADELRSAIVDPAHAAGLEIEEGLAADIVAEVQGQPGALPLLQYALSELCDQREDGRLTREAYAAIGRISGALASRADELFDGLDAGGQDATRRLFTRLVSLGEGAEDTRRRILRSEVDAIGRGDDSINIVIDAFGRHRLLSFDRDPITRTPTVEIAHEALLREWPRLRAWIDDDRDGLRVLRHLGESATAWDRLDRDAGELYRGVRLDHALAWADDHGDDLTALEASFLATSAEQRDADRQAERERAAQRVRQNRRLRIALAVVALALAGAIAGAIIALDQRGNANETAFASETRRLVADSASNVADDRRLALLLAAEVHRRDPSVESLGALQRALVATPSFVGYLGSGSGYGEVAFSADGAMLTAFTRQGVEVFDLETRAPVGQIIETDLEVVRGSLSRDGRVAALLDTNGSSDQRVIPDSPA